MNEKLKEYLKTKKLQFFLQVEQFEKEYIENDNMFCFQL